MNQANAGPSPDKDGFYPHTQRVLEAVPLPVYVDNNPNSGYWSEKAREHLDKALLDLNKADVFEIDTQTILRYMKPPPYLDELTNYTYVHWTDEDIKRLNEALSKFYKIDISCDSTANIDKCIDIVTSGGCDNGKV